MFTPEEKRELRKHSSMKAFTFMLDDVTKLEVLKRLKENGCDTKKGTLSALIRVLLNHFANTSNDDFLEYVFDEVQKEYLFTTKKNKRSSM